VRFLSASYSFRLAQWEILLSCRPKASNLRPATRLLVAFNVSLCNLQLWSFLEYGKSAQELQVPQFATAILFNFLRDRSTNTSHYTKRWLPLGAAPLRSGRSTAKAKQQLCSLGSLTWFIWMSHDPFNLLMELLCSNLHVNIQSCLLRLLLLGNGVH
jgi:hypothetical protein